MENKRVSPVPSPVVSPLIVTRCVPPSTVTLRLGESGLARRTVASPAKVIVSQLGSANKARSEPAPLSALLVTLQVAACTGWAAGSAEPSASSAAIQRTDRMLFRTAGEVTCFMACSSFLKKNRSRQQEENGS